MKQLWMKRPFRWTVLAVGGVLLLLPIGLIFEETAAAVDRQRIPRPTTSSCDPWRRKTRYAFLAFSLYRRLSACCF